MFTNQRKTDTMPALRAGVLFAAAAIFMAPHGSAWAADATTSSPAPWQPHTLPQQMVLQDEGSFFVGGHKIHTDFPSTTPTGLNAPGTYTVDQMYVHYWIPYTGSKQSKLPVIMVHGSNHTGVTYETTPDGREGWATYFVRHGYPVYVVDQAGRGRSSFDPTTVNQAIVQNDISVLPPAGFQLYPYQGAWVNFLFGPHYPYGWPDERFPLNAFETYTAELVPNTEVTLNNGGLNSVNDLAALLDKIGPAIIIVHSQSGVYGLDTVVKRTELVKGLISIEGGCAPVTTPDIKQHYSKVPFISVWGDHSIGAEGANGDARREGCQQTVQQFQQAGGDASFLWLPQDLGIKGNSHMMMMDNNNLQIADLLLMWIRANVNPKAQ